MLIVWLERSYAYRMADCQCLDHQLRRTSRNHRQQYYRPRSIPLRELSAKAVAYDLDDVGPDYGPFPIQPVEAEDEDDEAGCGCRNEKLEGHEVLPVASQLRAQASRDEAGIKVR